MKKLIFTLLTAVLVIICGSCKNHQERVDDEFEVENKSEVVVKTDSCVQEDEMIEPKTQEVKKPSKSTSNYTPPKREKKEPDNMRGFDPASEDDMDDNGMNRYFDNNDEEGWD